MINKSDAVQKYAGKFGWSVIPIHSILNKHCTCNQTNCSSPGKHPLTKNGIKDASCEQNKILAWWNERPYANIGIATGKISGFFVLDIDGEKGADSLKELEYKFHALPRTIEQITGSGGRHLFFKNPIDLKIRNRVAFLPGLDVRGDDGYVVAPPSDHITSKLYHWKVNRGPDEVDLAEAPEWLLNALDKIDHNRVKENFQGWRSKIGREVMQGERNNQITSVAGHLLRKEVAKDLVIELLQCYSKTKFSPPLDENEVLKIFGSISSYHKENVGDALDSGIVLGSSYKQTFKDWPEPEELRMTLKPVSIFKHSLIPDLYKGWLVDCAYRMQIPIEFLATALMVVLSSICGARCGIRPKKNDDWLVIPNLWGGIVGRPGVMKSPALAEILRPVVALEKEAKRRYDNEIAQFEGDKEINKIMKENLRGEIALVAKGKTGTGIDELKQKMIELTNIKEPVVKRYKTNDATIEKLAEILKENPRGILLFRDELTGLLVSWEKDGREAERAFFLEAWNGQGSITTDRIGRGTVHVDNVCISVLGGIQPAKLLSYLYQATSKFENDGLMQRMQLLVYPDEIINTKVIDESPDTDARNNAFESIAKLAEMDFTKYGASTCSDKKIPYFHFDDQAQEIFYRWSEELNEKLKDDESPVILEHLTKYRSLMPSIALIDHLSKLVIGQTKGDVTASSALIAKDWCDCLESHMRRIYGLIGDISHRAAIELAKKIKAYKLQDGFSLRDVYRSGWYLLETREAVQAACAELVEAGWLRSEIAKDGRTRTIYFINPKIKLK